MWKREENEKKKTKQSQSLVLSSVRGQEESARGKKRNLLTPRGPVYDTNGVKVCVHLKEFIVLFRLSNQPTERRLKRGTCATAGYDARAAVKPVWPEKRAAGWVLLPMCLIIDTVTSRRGREEKRRRGGAAGGSLQHWISGAKLGLPLRFCSKLEHRDSYFAGGSSVNLLFFSPMILMHETIKIRWGRISRTFLFVCFWSLFFFS